MVALLPWMIKKQNKKKNCFFFNNISTSIWSQRRIGKQWKKWGWQCHWMDWKDHSWTLGYWYPTAPSAEQGVVSMVNNMGWQYNWMEWKIIQRESGINSLLRQWQNWQHPFLSVSVACQYLSFYEWISGPFNDIVHSACHIENAQFCPWLSYEKYVWKVLLFIFIYIIYIVCLVNI